MMEKCHWCRSREEICNRCAYPNVNVNHKNFLVWNHEAENYYFDYEV